MLRINDRKSIDELKNKVIGLKSKMFDTGYVPEQLGQEYYKIKDEILDWAEQVLTTLDLELGKDSYTQMVILINKIDTQLNQYGYQRSTGNSSIEQIRENIKTQTNDIRNEFNSLSRFVLPEMAIGENNKLRKLLTSTDMDKAVSDVREKAATIENILKGITKESTKATVALQKNRFESSKSEHAGHEKTWLGVSIVAAILIFIQIVILLFWKVEFSGTRQEFATIIHHVLSNFLLLSFFGVLFKIALARYRNERMLKLLNQHRINVLEQYPTFEIGLENDLSGVREIRLQLAKFMFSDLAAGSFAEDGNQDLNINPVFNLAEKALEKVKP